MQLSADQQQMRRPKATLEIRIKATFLKVINNSVIYINSIIILYFSRTWLTIERRNFLAIHLSSTFLNTWTTNEIFQQSGKQGSFRQILKSSASICENSDPSFLKAATGIQSGWGAFDKSRLVITFSTNLGVTEILFSFRLVLEGATGK